MKIIFLGTGAAWGHPELGCDCAACKHAQNHKGKDWRRRTALFIETDTERILVDCGPDIRQQLMGRKALADLDYGPIENINFLLITHGHMDHISGLDELNAPHRSGKIDPIPTYATELAWEQISKPFGYLIGQKEGEGKPLIRRTAVPGVELVGPHTRIRPFTVEHGPTAPGAVGYILWSQEKKVVYTGDFYDIPVMHEHLKNPDLLIMECNWFNEPLAQPVTSWHMSFQRGIEFIKKWQPKAVVLVHISHEDFIREARQPLQPSPPISHDQWLQTINQLLPGLLPGIKVTVAHDGMSLTV